MTSVVGGELKWEDLFLLLLLSKVAEYFGSCESVKSALNTVIIYGLRSRMGISRVIGFS